MEDKINELQKKTGTGEESFIVQCPSCQAKFAVPLALLPSRGDKESENPPKFHCSRCDGIFSQSITENNEDDEGKISAQRIDGESSEYSKHEPAFEKVSATEELLKQAVQMELPLGTKHEKTLRSSAYEEAERTLDVLAETQEINFSEFEKGKPSKKSFKKKDNFSRESLLKEIAARQEEGGEAVEMLPGAWQGTRRLLAPCMIVVLFLVLFAFSLSANFGPTVAVADRLLASKSQIPPLELFMNDVEYTHTTLLDGSVIPVIRGTLVNRSLTTMNEVILEGLMFGGGGNLVYSEKINMMNAGDNYEAWSNMSSVAELLKMQSGNLRRGWNLKPGERRNFAMALTGAMAEDAGAVQTASTVQTARYYSARIYSVR